MAKVNWKRLDDLSFVYLIGDLLEARGFTAVQYQGDGPDGGIDLFATELIPIGLQNSQPFRWGIQCKFSIHGSRRAIGDRDISDVEGILRSDRYAAQNLRGYMLLTNRRVGGDVIERLRGIDARSRFRTSAVDGKRLDSLLTEHPTVVERHFGAIGDLLRGFGRPLLASSTSSDEFNSPTHPFPVIVQSRFSKEPKSNKVEIQCIIDTGADVTCIPSKALNSLAPLPYKPVKVENWDGAMTVNRTHFVEIVLGSRSLGTVYVLAIPGDYGLIGRDLLQKIAFFWNGPKGTLEVFTNLGD